MSMSTSDRSRAWVFGGRLLIVTVLGMVLILTVLGVGIWLIIGLLAGVGFTAGWLLDPRRSWWGPEPARILNDPERRTAYRKRETLFLVVALVIVFLVPLFLAWLGVIGPAVAA